MPNTKSEIDANLKESKSGRSPILPFFDPQKIVQSRDLPIKSQKCIKYQIFYPQNAKKSAKICLKNVSYALLFLLSGRFGDPYGRVGDSVCIWKTLE